MAKIVALKSMLAAAGLALIALGAASSVQAQAVPHTPQIKFEPANSHPPIPASQCRSKPVPSSVSQRCPQPTEAEMYIDVN